MKTSLKAVCFCFVFAASALAEPLITFDDLSPAGSSVPVNFRGLNWVNFGYLDALHYSGNPSGYQAGMVSPNNVAYNIFAGTASITGGSFDFLSAYLTAAWFDNLHVEVRGYISGSLVYDNTYVLSATAPTLLQFNYYGVDEVVFIASGGSPHAGYSGSGEYFAMDNVNVVVYVPYRQLIQNGGFESGDFTGWGHFGNTNSTFVSTNSIFVHSGVYAAQVGPSGSNGYLSQILAPTTAGEAFQLSFWLNNPNAANSEFAAWWNGVTLVDQTNQPTFGWSNMQFQVTSTLRSTFLEFGFRNNPSFFGFDDISVTPVALVKNGGFESGDFSNWTPSGVTNNDNVTTPAVFRRAGTYGAEFGAVGAPGYIAQTLTTYPGQSYLLSCWLDSTDGPTNKELLVFWNGKTILDQTNLTAFGWTNLHFVVTAPTTQTPLKFGLRDDPSYLGLDEISVATVPLVQNGGFETSDFTGWTQSGNTGSTGVSTNTSYVNLGFYGAYVGPVGSLGYLSQTLATVPGQAYYLTFFLNALSSGATNNEFLVTWNGATIDDQTNLTTFTWYPYGYLLTASATNTVLQFGFRNNPTFFGFDDVIVEPLLQPVIQSVQESKSIVTFTWSVMPGFSYQVQYITNLTHTNWTNLGLSRYATNNTMSFSDVIPPDPERFYRIELLLPAILF